VSPITARVNVLAPPEAVVVDNDYIIHPHVKAAHKSGYHEWWARARATASNVPFVHHVGLTTSANVAIALFGMCTGLLSARLLGPEGRGELAAIQTWPTVLATFAMLGLDSAVVYWTSRDRDHGARHLATALAMIGMAAFVAIGAGWMLMPVLLHAQTDAVIGAARLFLVMIPIYALIGLPYQMLRALGAWRLWNILRVAPAAVWLAVLLLVAYAGRTWATPTRLSVAFLLSHVWLVVPVWIVTRRYVPGPLRIDPTLYRPMLRYGVPDMLTLLPRMLNQRLDQLLMAALLDRRTLGLYVVAVAWSSAASPLLSSIGPVLFPTLSATLDRERQLAWLRRVIRVTVVAALALTAAAFVLTPMALPFLFGSAFRAAVPAALVLVIANGVSAVNLVLADGLRGLGRTRTLLVSEIAGLAVTAVMLWALLRPFGATGAAVTSLVAYATVSVVLLTSIRLARTS
jgi:O-antigen/teichoic acid export membrane protein